MPVSGEYVSKTFRACILILSEDVSIHNNRLRLLRLHPEGTPCQSSFTDMLISKCSSAQILQIISDMKHGRIFVQVLVNIKI